MLNALVISKNVGFIQKLLCEIDKHNLNIRLSNLSTNKFETFEILNFKNPDVILLDSKLGNEFSKSFLKNYKKPVITLGYRDGYKLLTLSTVKELKELIESHDLDVRREKVKRELHYIGYNFKYKGTQYLLDTILQMYINQNNLVDNLQSTVYPLIAEKYQKTIHNVKSSINKATECMYYECDSIKLEKYFQFSDDSKPTVKEVVFTIINKI